MSRFKKWLRAKTMSLNLAKTEVSIFRSERTSITKKVINLRVSVQKAETKKQTKYLGVLLDEHFETVH